MFFVALITFSLAHLAPGSPFDKNPNRPMPQETIDRISKYYGVDQPIPIQFVTYLGNVLHGDLGISFTRRTPVVDVIGRPSRGDPPPHRVGPRRRSRPAAAAGSPAPVSPRRR